MEVSSLVSHIYWSRLDFANRLDSLYAPCSLTQRAEATTNSSAAPEQASRASRLFDKAQTVAPPEATGASPEEPASAAQRALSVVANAFFFGALGAAAFFGYYTYSYTTDQVRAMVDETRKQENAFPGSEVSFLPAPHSIPALCHIFSTEQHEPKCIISPPSHVPGCALAIGNLLCMSCPSEVKTAHRTHTSSGCLAGKA